MNQLAGSGQGDFPPTSRDAFRVGLAQMDPASWAARAGGGLRLALPIFKSPNSAPEFYGELGGKSLALALTGSVYSQGEFKRARDTSGAKTQAKLKILGLNALAAAMADSPEVQGVLADIDPDRLVEHLPTAIDLMSKSPTVRDPVLEGLHEHPPLRGMFGGISGIWDEAVEATREPRRLSGISSLRWGRQSAEDQQDRERGVLIANGYDTLLVATAAYLGYDVKPAGDLARESETDKREVIHLRRGKQKPEYELWRPAIPPDLHKFSQEGELTKLGINIPEGRKTATGNSIPALEALQENEDASVIEAIREAVIGSIGAHTGLDMAPQGIEDGSNTLAFALATNASARFSEVLQSLDLLEPQGLRDSKRLAECVARACEKAEKIAEQIALNNQGLTSASASLESRALMPDPNYQPDPDRPDDPVKTIPATPLLTSLCHAINNDVRQYAHGEKQMDTKRFNGYIASAYGFVETLCELLSTIPQPQETKRVA